ncbi:MAG: hypothetical protein ABSA52_15910 [Candidatus Binatia bacterium]
MTSRGRPTKLRVDADGVRMETSGVRPGVWLVVLVLALVGATVVFFQPGRRSADEATAPAAPAGKVALNVSGRAQAELAAMKPQHPQAPAPTQPLRSAVRLVPKAANGPAPVAVGPVEPHPVAPAEPAPAAPDEEKPAANEMGEDQLTGIALFPLPGTKPILRGFVVPDGFEVPEGYVKHYQTTDHGQQLAPILMFHPDYQLVDENGQPIPMPKDRVVPRELLPPGMSDQILEVPPAPSDQPLGSARPQENPRPRSAPP